MLKQNASASVPAPRRKGLIDILFYSWANNVWFGIVVFVLIFIYSSIGSAIPPVRQHPWFDMTEMGWFHWWPFDTLIALMVITLTTVTLKQIPFRLVNLGVWTIHVGIVILCLGSVMYFSQKLEGDAPVFRRQISINIPGNAEPAKMVVRPANSLKVASSQGPYEFRITQLFPEWTIASGNGKGKQAMMVWVDCLTPVQKFTRQLLVGYPQYTEDILPDRTRAKKTLGKRLVDEELDLHLEYLPTTEFFLIDSAALYARRSGETRWKERPIDDLPRYHDHIASLDEISPNGDQSMPIRPISLQLPPAEEEGDPLADYDVRVTGYLRYAHATTDWRDGGDELNPVAKLTLTAGPDARLDYTLIAFDPRRSQSENGQLIMRWVESAEALDRLVAGAQGSLTFQPQGLDQEVEFPLGDIHERGDNAPLTQIKGTGFAFRVKSVMHNLVTQSGRQKGHSMSVATVQIQKPDGSLITRFVSDLPNASRDIGEGGGMQQPDPIIACTFKPGVEARITLAVGPEGVGPDLLLADETGVIQRLPLQVGQPTPVTDQVSMHLYYLHRNAVEEIRPQVVPRARRDRDARELYSMIKLEISKGDWNDARWYGFDRYALPDRQYAIPRRITYRPTTIKLPDGQSVELIYSRQRHPLPAPVALEDFVLDTHDGGYTGATTTVRDFISKLRFKMGNEWSEPMQMSSNNPAKHGGFWFFQSTWDPPGPDYAGMNYTGVGVGNRHGVGVQLAGCIIAVAGMIFAFYIKPVIRRRAQDRAAARAAAQKTGGSTIDADAKKTLAAV